MYFILFILIPVYSVVLRFKHIRVLSLMIMVMCEDSPDDTSIYKSALERRADSGAGMVISVIRLYSVRIWLSFK